MMLYFLGLFYSVINLCIYAWTWNAHKVLGADDWICSARGAAQLIYFNLALSLVSMMRVTISRLKYYRISKWLCLDHHIKIHQIAGHGIWFGILLHCFAYATKPKYHYWTNLTGCCMFLIIMIMWILSQKWIRKSRYFELFYFNHYLSLVAMILLYYHVLKINYWMLLPILCYACDRFYRFYCTFYPTQLAESVAWDGNILELKIFRPCNFNYVSGDYTFVCIPAVSKLQWHPFSLSSDPRDPHLLTIHLRISGNWTKKVNDFCAQIRKSKGINNNIFQPLVYLDGPLSAPASSMCKEKNVILVAQGIGVTPFISYLRSMMKKNDLSKNVTLLWFSRDIETYNWCKNDPLLKELFLETSSYQNLKIHCHHNSSVNELLTRFDEIKNKRNTVFVCASPDFCKKVKEITKKFKWNFKSEYF